MSDSLRFHDFPRALESAIRGFRAEREKDRDCFSFFHILRGPRLSEQSRALLPCQKVIKVFRSLPPTAATQPADSSDNCVLRSIIYALRALNFV